MKHPTSSTCPDCPAPERHSRRSFLRTATAGLALAAARPLGAVDSPSVPRTETGASEKLAASLFESLDEKQRGALCFPFDHPLRRKVDNNWHVVSPRVDQILNPDQQAMVREIFLKLHHPDHADRILAATEHDNGPRGLGACAVALFGEPRTGGFQFVLSGRHVTRRCDGPSSPEAAFGGPIFYGHAALSDDEAADHPGNVYWFQARRANEVFQALDGKQRASALLDRARPERGTDTVKLEPGPSGYEGLPVSDLTRDQRELVRRVMADLLAPFRKEDADEAMRFVDAAGLERIHLAFFKQDDIGQDGVWDIWQLSGPGLLWYFRGSPHVHTWVNVAAPRQA